jgi:2-hydroxy-3-keto-5-methylthiopentenyl-1-phosphate phosphatase
MRLILDWDGTCTLDDTMDALVREFGAAELLDVHLGGGGLTLHQIIEDELGSIRVPLEDAQAWLVANVRIRPGFHELVERFDPLLLSSNVRQLIEPVLEREGVDVELVANDLEPGWKVRWRDDTICETCGQACKRGTLPAGVEIVYVGDGFSDRCAALASDRVFATGPLARYLAEQGAEFTPFDDFHTVVDALGSLV